MITRGIDVIGLRFRHQLLVGSRARTPGEVVSHLGAVQAQEYGPARWAIGQRMPSAFDRTIERAFDAGDLIRTHILRPTWHFVAPSDLRWMLSLSAPRVHRANGFSYRLSGLDAKIRARGADLICRALEGQQHLTRKELADRLKRARLPHAGHALAYMVMHAELETLICSGPRRGRQFTYALVDERVPPARTRAADACLAELTERYFTSHGPATIRDFCWWSGLTRAQAREGIALSGARLVSAEIDDRLHYWSASARTSCVAARGRVDLLPVYDEFLIAYRDRQWCTGTSPSGVGPFGPAREHPHQLVIDGKVEGAWRRTLTSASMQIDVVPYRRLSAGEQRALETAADRQAAFLALEPILRVRSASRSASRTR